MTGEFSGTMGETVKEICKRAEINCEFNIVPLKRAYELLKNKKTDGLITIKVGQFNECCIASKWASPWAAGFFSHQPIETIPQRPNEVIGRDLIIVNGMRSPFVFMPNLEKWKKDKKINFFNAPDINIATKMFNAGRAELLWGSEDFNWYFSKQEDSQKRNFLPLIVKPVVIWLRKENQHLMEPLNQAFYEMLNDGTLNRKHLLINEMMSQRYIDAPYKFKQ